jgi:hypothetical protein
LICGPRRIKAVRLLGMIDVLRLPLGQISRSERFHPITTSWGAGSNHRLTLSMPRSTCIALTLPVLGQARPSEATTYSTGCWAFGEAKGADGQNELIVIFLFKINKLLESKSPLRCARRR